LIISTISAISVPMKKEADTGVLQRILRMVVTGDRIFIPSIDVDERFEGARITGS